MSDLIARAEAAIVGAKRLEIGGVDPFYPVGLITDLVAALKEALANDVCCEQCGGGCERHRRWEELGLLGVGKRPPPDNSGIQFGVGHPR